ncbi:MAG TPA: HAD-IA family hydrolase [Woeseiaceae bacterium]|nr:HAD-IA family hydrolase [Woeseiaceae bacterium]|tara:strand:- start:24636 stop:25334 length:699 start_codon:yes stop_codon:yes gene_type:complete
MNKNINYSKSRRMDIHQNEILSQCHTLMLDMDGTILDLAYDSFIWLDLVPKEYAKKLNIPLGKATAALQKHFVSLQGSLKWYCLDHWSELLGIDILLLHEKERGRIKYLSGAQKFLEVIKQSDIRMLLVSNSHRDILKLKIEETGLDNYFDGIYLSHDFKTPKENRLFWTRLRSIEKFDLSKTIFIDDTPKVLKAAKEFGIHSIFQITDPDSKQPRPIEIKYPGISGVIDLI